MVKWDEKRAIHESRLIEAIREIKEASIGRRRQEPRGFTRRSMAGLVWGDSLCKVARVVDARARVAP